MKTITYKIVVSLLAFMTLSVAKAHRESGKYAQPDKFTISKRYIDSSLADGKSKLIFTFFGGGSPKQKTVRFGMNKQETRFTTDTNGRYTKTVDASKYKLYFYLNSDYEEVISDTLKLKDQEVVEITVRFLKTEREMKVKKPVIYVYPEEKTDVEIKLDVNGKLGFTWPVYHESWKFTANPDGKIEMDGKEYNYLFWESEMPEYALDKNKNEGFLVATDTLLSFLENSLDKMGFSSVEAADFITFWYPQMIKNEKNHVQFLFNEACDTYARLNISPQPDHIYRVGMVWSEAKNENISLTPQEIPTVNRNGFTVIEWGGMETENVFEF